MDGVLRDVISWWENVKYQNSINLDEQWINSGGSSFSNSLNKKAFKDNISKEFNFFDKEYFKNHDKAKINFFYSGHGRKDAAIGLVDFSCKYLEIVKHILH